MRLPFICLALATVTAVPNFALAEKVGVLSMTVEGGAAPTIGAQLANRVAEVIGKRSGAEVIAPDDIRALLEKEAQNQLLGCDDNSCLAEIGGALGADILVKGRLSKIETGYALSLSAVEATGAKALNHVSQTWGGPSIGLLELVVPMVTQLFAERGQKLTGAIALTGAVDGSQIFIDDEVRGTAPAGQMGEVPIGGHRVRLLHEGHESFEQWIVVRTNALTDVAVTQKELEDAPVYATWWFWTGMAAIVGGAAVTSAVLLSGDDAPPGATGINVSVNADSAFTGGR